MPDTIQNLAHLLQQNPYPGRGIVLGQSADAQHAAVAYFIMGRSEHSRNRVFVRDGHTGDEIMIEPFAPKLVRDPSLIIYRPVRQWGDTLIVSNGDQTDTIYQALQLGGSFESALRTRCYEPDAPNFTPRISGKITLGQGGCPYTLSILRAACGHEEAPLCDRLFFEYAACPGQGRLIHTYASDGQPLPCFAGEPRRVAIPDDAQAFAQEIWDSLNADNRVALYVRYIRLKDGQSQTVVYNRHALPTGGQHA